MSEPAVFEELDVGDPRTDRGYEGLRVKCPACWDDHETIGGKVLLMSLLGPGCPMCGARFQATLTEVENGD